MRVSIFRFSVSFCFALCLFSATLYAQHGNYSRVQVTATPALFVQAAQRGVALDHLTQMSRNHLMGDFSAREIQVFTDLGMQVEYVIDDVEKFYAGRLASSPAAKTAGTPVNFNLGSMGSYLTFTEAISELDDMYSLYPSLITLKDTIGTSYEGRPILMCKISDNPGTDEAEPEVLYDALIHAREPVALMQQIYYMWYLLENYGTDDEVTYLVNNREMYFVPIINPDGYVYNETTNPGGGGMWRKNRHVIVAGEVGVDLNRNYGYEFGYDDIGSSPDPASETYRGPSGFSEPETATMRDFCISRDFKIALNYHTYGNLLIYPWGYLSSFYTPDSALFVEYGKLLTEENHYLYGTGDQTVGYVTNGDADDWMYGEQVAKPKIMSMTPETGEDSEGFWPTPSKIIPYCEGDLLQNLRAAWLAGDYIHVTPQPHESYTGVSVWVPIDFRNLGLVASAAVSAIFTTTDPSIISVNNTLTLGSFITEESKVDSFSLTLAAGIPEGTVIRGIVETTFGGGYVMYDSVEFIYGTPNCFLSYNAESGGGWTGGWARTTGRKHSGTYSYTDSPIGDYGANESNLYTLSTSFDLTFYTAPKIKYWASWFLEAGWDYVQVLATSNGGLTWNPVSGDYTHSGSGFFQPSGEPVYDGTQISWVLETVDLSAYAGFSNVKIAFNLESDGFAEFDGFYFDDLEVCGYKLATSLEDELSGKVKAMLYPNPASGEVYYSASPGREMESAALEMYNLHGLKVVERTIRHGEKVNVNDCAVGIYTWRITPVNGVTSTGRIVIR